jgi:hypothetical protein
MNKIIITALLTGGIAAAGTSTALAQANDALLNKLVSKGVLTKQEADELKKDTDAGFDKAYRSKTGLPDWVNQLKLSGDVRGRFDGIYTDNEVAGGPNTDRNRLRYRLRVGATATFKDNFELGFRLTSGDAQGTFGGDAISGNSTMQDNGSKKFVWIDLAYGKWTPINNDTWKLGATIGKMENPFVVSPLVFDDDYTPEGLAMTGSYSPSKNHTLRLAGGMFWLDEINQGPQASDDPFMFGAQARWDAKWTPALDTSIGAGIFAITDQITLTNFTVPNVNVGNTRNADGTLANEMIPVVLDAALTYSLDPFPTHRAKFPIKVFGTYMYNLGSADDNQGYEVGLSAGKAGKKDTWELAYRWRYLDRDAWFEEVVDSDFGAFYQAAHLNSGAGSGYRAGTNVKGHIFKASYSPADAFTLSVTYFMTELVDASVVAGRKTESDAGRIQVDASWKF